MIDIQKLKQFPLAFKVFEGWCEKHFGTWLVLYLDKVKNEDILLFLDEQNIHVTIGAMFSAKNEVKFVYHILEDATDGIRYKNRTEAINESILKAFELLENKLKTN